MTTRNKKQLLPIVLLALVAGVAAAPSEAHAAQVKPVNASGEIASTSVAALFTSEPYSKRRHLNEQRELDLLSLASFDSAPEDQYFAILPEFVLSSMRGDLEGVAVVLMGCDVLTNAAMAQAFIDRGAEGVVGWDGTVSASHTDAATLNMLERLVLDDLSLQEAAQAAAAEVGPDPYYDSALVSYPLRR